MASDEQKPVGSPEYDKDPVKYHKQCFDIITEAINNNPIWTRSGLKETYHFQIEDPFMRIIMDSMKEHGCDVTPDFFKCRPCPIKTGGFYDSKLGIIICENQIAFKATIEDTLMHELVHAYDVCRAEIDTSDCLQVACTEIRAANLSGECNWTREIARGQFKFQKQYPACVKRRAEATLRNHPQCAQRAPEYIEAAWRSCYRDTSPLGFVPL